MKSIIDYRKTFISENKKICNALEILNNNQIGIVLVIKEDGQLLGTLTDGDIRRGLLKGKTLGDNVTEIMNKKFIFSYENDSLIYKKNIFSNGISHLPILNKNNNVIQLLVSRDYKNEKYLNPIVIMAGGIGSRLRPHTYDCPKPMLKINGKPILEIVIENCIENGFQEFYISVNYLKDLIIDYFGDGSKLGVNIYYLEENKALGTAGSLSLLPKHLDESFIVLNGDVLTKFNPSSILDFHLKNNAFATISVRDYFLEVPYGVLEIEDKNVVNLVEKPIYTKKVNAGVYALDPKILEYIKFNEKIDMPDIIKTVLNLNKKIVACPIHEYWIDIGRPETLKEANISWEK